MDEDGADSEMGPLFPGMLLALLRRAIRKEGVAKKSDVQTLESKVEQRLQSSEKERNDKFGASEKKVQEIAVKVDSSIQNLGGQMSRLESCLETMADRLGSNSSTASPSLPRGPVVTGFGSTLCRRAERIPGRRCPCSSGVGHPSVALQIRNSREKKPLPLNSRSGISWVPTRRSWVASRCMSPTTSCARTARPTRATSRRTSSSTSFGPAPCRNAASPSRSRSNRLLRGQRTTSSTLGESEIVAHKYEACGRTLRMYAAPSWQELGKPGANGWEWNTSGFIDAQVPLPSFLAAPSADGRDGDL